MKPRVEILMSTYNGEKFLAEQLDSILAQTHQYFVLTVRDDGSKDGTPDILSRYAATDERITYCVQENRGVVGSFYWLLKNSSPLSNYVAFSDQDDVWLPNKLERALDVLSRYDETLPLLYCSRVEYVSAGLGHLDDSPMMVRPVCLNNALIQNVATGCTVVMNKAARDLLLEREWPPQVLMHDWWSYIVVSAFGKVVYDDFVSIKYRQHGGNVIGGTVSFVSDYRSRIINFLSRRRKGVFGCYDQAYSFWLGYKDELKGESRGIVSQFIESKRSFLSRLNYLTSSQRVYRHRFIDDVLVRLLILSNKY
ncbi:glycosyltransferase [Geobacter metallireducens GS-15]|uniref:Glycosyltransferase n=1 Tax=Geobacter metallireducens (strain ATCC 53774 / DSM 7210 / GS-15) TaxID=269799 RepID=Q39TM1_GEOMG|nr:glycosyltransferase family 2 protein [Geobacter metallireducens]ABB32403.1 glycosyltransferase [Geobacter metallireducens GS-15]